MPNRIIREALLTSKRIACLKYDNRWLYIGLLLSADDHGRIEYTSDKLLNAKIFPLDETRDSDISRWLAECEKAGLLLIYCVNSSRYIQLYNFKQQTRSESKCPAPPNNMSCVSIDTQMLSKDKANDHLGGGVVEGVGGGGDARTPSKLRNFNPIQQEPTPAEVRQEAERQGVVYSVELARDFIENYKAKGWMLPSGVITNWTCRIRMFKNSGEREREHKKATSPKPFCNRTKKINCENVR